MSEPAPFTPINQPPALTVKNIFAGKEAQNRFTEMLGKKAQGFITSVLQIVSSSNRLREADPMTVYYAAAMAATMDLPINQNLGFAWLVPYKNKGLMQAQFQMGYKGYIQLALRTGQYLRINVVDVYQNQFKSFNELTEELDADFGVDGEGPIVGYCSYFKLINGFEKTTYWSRQKVDKHAKKYSQSYEFDSSQWKSNFDSMGKKTVLKNSLSKWGILSIEMQTAILVDQAVIKNEEGTDLQYVDNDELSPAEKAENATKSAEATLKKKAGKDAGKQMEADLTGKLSD